MHQNQLRFESDPNNAGKKFRSTDCVVDAETALTSSGSDPSFEEVFRETKEMHSLIFSIIGDVLECRRTSVSIYDDACFHIFASDVAFDKYGKPYFLEMNSAMAFYNVWNKREQAEFLRGAAALIEGTASPYDLSDTDSSVWERI